MNWIQIFILMIYLSLQDFTEAYTGNATLVAVNHRNQDTSGGLVKDTTSIWENAGTDDVRCTSLDDITAARRSLCPAQCSCSPLDGQEVWTKLTVDCSTGAQSNFTQHLVQLLSTCTSELLELNITHTPLTTIPEVVCRLSKIQKLNLDGNRLASLPSNCFTHMHNLTSFFAASNCMTLLQVRTVVVKC